jgi:curved DNA-binding protein CbpA
MEKKFAEMNYYERLDIKPDATAAQIRSAYNYALQMYQADSLVSYSFFSKEERKEILDLIEKAYLTLINEKAREIYDNELTGTGIIDILGKSAEIRKEPVNIFDINRHTDNSVTRRNLNLELKVKAAQNERVQEIASRPHLSGADLKAIREELGVAIEKIHQETKIRLDYLHFIEGDNTEKLPAPVFLKGFIKAYFKSLCVEPAEELTVRYMNGLPRKN